MALDDTVKALDLNVDTVDGNVTVTGRVRSDAERERALALARETTEFASVVDKTTIAEGERGNSFSRFRRRVRSTRRVAARPTGPDQPVARSCCSIASQRRWASFDPFT